MNLIERLFKTNDIKEVKESKDTEHDEIEYREKQMIFEITPYSREMNLGLETHRRLRIEASRVKELTKEQKKNIDVAIYLEEYQAKTSRHNHAVFTGAWYCRPMRKYIKNKGYKIWACGNDFDLCVTIPDKR